MNASTTANTSRSSAEKSVRINAKRAAAYLGVGASTLARWRADGSGPIFIQVGSRGVRYDLADLDDWLAQRKRAGLGALAIRVRPAQTVLHQRTSNAQGDDRWPIDLVLEI